MKNSSLNAKRYRSAMTGRFVSGAFANRYPSTTVGERRGSGGTRGAYRSARTGRFVTGAYAERHRRTTVRGRR